MHYIFLACFGFLIGYQFKLAESTDCYVCFSWRDQGCEEDYVTNINLTTCGVPPLPPSSFWRGDRDREREDRNLILNAPPSTCIKEVITFLDPSIRSQHDRYNRFNRAWVERKCGFPIQAGYRSGRDLVDDCEEVEVTIDGNAGIKRSCSCSTDGCNSATPLNLDRTMMPVIGFISILTLLTQMA